MITIFNRKEIAITYNMQQQADIRRVLSSAGIRYTVSTRDLTSPGCAPPDIRANTGSLGQPVTSSVEYRIFVHKKDYEAAEFAVRDCFS